MSDDDKAFIRQYAAEIASALRAQEEGTGSVVPSVLEDSTRALYRALCFDEPVVEDIPHLATAASALCRQLTIPSSDYALTNRLVNGIVYLCRRQQGHTTTKAHAVGDDTSTISNGDHHPSATTAVILAKLVFCVLVQVPLECCQGLLSKDLSTLQRFLGSYKGSVDMRSETIMETTTTNDHEVTQLVHALSSSGGTIDDDHLPDQHDNSDHPAATSPLTQENQETSSWQEEVWAAESDPSDYDYDEDDGEGEDHEALRSPDPLVAVDVVDLLDPIVLSRPDPQRTLEDAREAIGSLLQQANYSLMAPIFQMPKKQVEAYTAQLTQLLLFILQPPQSILSQSEDHDSSSSSLQNVMLTPLWILRDAALHHPPTHDQSSYAAVTYLEVIQTLLAIDQAYQADTTTSTPPQQQQQQPPHSSNPLCSASIVGLSALSSWCCCSAEIPRSVTMTAIVDAMNDVAYVMERAVETGYRKHLQHSIPPIIEILIGMTFDDRTSSGAMTGGGNSMVCQTLLNSGLLRQLLVLSLDNNKNRTSEDNESPPYYLDHAIWGLCVVYPTVVGKYVARYPGFPSIVRRYSPPTPRSSRDCVQSILWNSFAYSQCVVDGSTTPQMVWKSRGSIGVTPLTQDECREVCQKSWTQLCTMVQSTLSSSHDASISPKQSLDILKDWERLLTFVSIPSFAPTFQNLMMTNYDVQLSGILGDITTATTNIGNAEGSDVRIPKEKREGDDDEEPPKKSSMNHHELIVATTRKTLKQYALFFQGSAQSSSKTD